MLPAATYLALSSCELHAVQHCKRPPKNLVYHQCKQIPDSLVPRDRNIIASRELEITVFDSHLPGSSWVRGRLSWCHCNQDVQQQISSQRRMRITCVVNSSRRISADADAAPQQSWPTSVFNAFNTVCAAPLTAMTLSLDERGQQ